MTLILRRLIAHLIDSIIVGIPISALLFSFNFVRFIINLLPFVQLPGRGFFVFQANTIILLMIYEIIALSIFKTTIGKSLMGIELITLDQSSSRFRVLARTAFKALFSQPPLFIFLIISVFFMVKTDGKRALHDHMMRTEIHHVD